VVSWSWNEVISQSLAGPDGERDDQLTTAEREELGALRRENAQLKRANEGVHDAGSAQCPGFWSKRRNGRRSSSPSKPGFCPQLLGPLPSSCFLHSIGAISPDVRLGLSLHEM
jgi:hypothetical protein